MAQVPTDQQAIDSLAQVLHGLLSADAQGQQVLAEIKKAPDRAGQILENYLTRRLETDSSFIHSVADAPGLPAQFTNIIRGGEIERLVQIASAGVVKIVIQPAPRAAVPARVWIPALVALLAVGVMAIIVLPTHSPAPTPTPTEFPKTAQPKPVRVILGQFGDCRYEQTLKKQIETSATLAPSIKKGEVTLEVALKTFASSDEARQVKPPADLVIWGKCTTEPTINFELLSRSGLPQVYEPPTIATTENKAIERGRKIALGLIYYLRRDYEQADKLLDQSARDSEAPLALALLYGNNLLYESPKSPTTITRSLQVYTQALPTAGALEAYVHNNRGIVLMEQGLGPGDLVAARTAFTQAISLEPNEPWFYFNRASAWFSGKDTNLELARADCERAQKAAATLNAPPAIAGAQACLIEYQIRTAYDPQAKGIPPDKYDQILERLKTLDAGDWSLPHFLRGVLYGAAGYPEEAKREYACYLIRVQPEVKLVIEQIRREQALGYLRGEARPLETLCPLFQARGADQK